MNLGFTVRGGLCWDGRELVTYNGLEGVIQFILACDILKAFKEAFASDGLGSECCSTSALHERKCSEKSDEGVACENSLRPQPSSDLEDICMTDCHDTQVCRDAYCAACTLAPALPLSLPLSHYNVLYALFICCCYETSLWIAPTEACA